MNGRGRELGRAPRVEDGKAKAVGLRSMPRIATMKAWRSWGSRLSLRGELFAGHEDNDGEAEEEDGTFDALGTLVELVEVKAGRVIGGNGGDVAVGAIAVSIHGGEDVEVDVGGGEEHDGGEEELDLIAAAEAHGGSGEQEGGGEEEDGAAGEADEVEDAEGGADDQAGFMRGGISGEGGGGEDEGEEDETADPGDDREELEEAEESGHRFLWVGRRAGFSRGPDGAWAWCGLSGSFDSAGRQRRERLRSG
jgi:hypothetical protein